MNYTLQDIASDIFMDLSQPDNLNIPYITAWLRANIGRLNNAIGTSYVIDPNTLETDLLLTENEAAIFNKIYLLNYYEKQINSVLQGAMVNNIDQIKEGDSTILFARPTDVTDGYREIRKDLAEELVKEIALYRMNKATVDQITGDDTIDDTFDTDSSIDHSTIFNSRNLF